MCKVGCYLTLILCFANVTGNKYISGGIMVELLSFFKNDTYIDSRFHVNNRPEIIYYYDGTGKTFFYEDDKDVLSNLDQCEIDNIDSVVKNALCSDSKFYCDDKARIKIYANGTVKTNNYRIGKLYDVKKGCIFYIPAGAYHMDFCQSEGLKYLSFCFDDNDECFNCKKFCFYDSSDMQLYSIMEKICWYRYLQETEFDCILSNYVVAFVNEIMTHGNMDNKKYKEYVYKTNELEKTRNLLPCMPNRGVNPSSKTIRNTMSESRFGGMKKYNNAVDEIDIKNMKQHIEGIAFDDKIMAEKLDYKSPRYFMKKYKEEDNFSKLESKKQTKQN